MGINRQQALDCLRSDDLIGMGMEADSVRRRLHPEGVVTYRCVHPVRAGELPQTVSPYTNVRVICAAAAEIDNVSSSVSSLRGDARLWIEVGITADPSAPGVRNAIQAWASAGADSIAVDALADAASPSDTFRNTLALHREAHRAGMRTSVAIPFGSGESLDDRIGRFQAVREAQDATGGFAAFVCVARDTPGGRYADGTTAIERLKMLATGRMYLDNIEHMQAPQVGEGLKVLQSGLRFGADDAEIRLPQNGTTEPDLRRVIRDAGFVPVERNGAYTVCFLD